MATSHVRWMLAGGVGLAVGLALGGLGPRAENRVLRARVETLEAASRGGGGLPAGLSGVLRGEVWREGDTPAPSPRPAPVAEAPDPSPPADDGPPPMKRPSGGAEVVVVGDDEVPEGDGGRLAAAREAMELRQRQAWRALQEQADPSPEELATIESAVDAMNDELLDIAESFALSVGEGRPPERREMMVFAADTLETMIATEDVIADTLGPDRTAGVDPEVLDPTAYVDARVVDALESVEGLGR